MAERQRMALPLTQNKATVQAYMDAFARSDHPGVLDCVTDDVEWLLPGAFHLHGKAAFDREIENPAFVGSPAITVSRMVEENDVVVAEGHVRCKKRDGEVVDLDFCDVFEMRGGKIRRLISYLLQVKR